MLGFSILDGTGTQAYFKFQVVANFRSNACIIGVPWRKYTPSGGKRVEKSLEY
jgi:hypothetical protein